MKCCDFHKTDCDQGRQCPNRLASHGNTCPARKVLQTATPLITDNSDGSSAGNTIDELLDDTGLMLLQGIALLFFVVSVILYASL